jgi:hypothetical protein
MTAPSHKTLRQKILATGEPSTHDAWLGKSQRTVEVDSSDAWYQSVTAGADGTDAHSAQDPS